MAFFRDTQFKSVDTHLQLGNYAQAGKQMSDWQLAYLVLFQEQFDQHKKKLRHPELTTFWQQRRESLSLPELPDFIFQEQIGLDDVDFVTGYVLYLLALKQKKENKPQLYSGYLDQAIAHGSFHAIQKFLSDLETDKTDKNEGYCKRLVEKLQDLESIVSVHGTPGYLLLANGYLHVALNARRIEDGKIMSDTAFTFVWKFLNLANLAVKNSLAAINNAYFGLGLSRSNPQGLESIDSMLGTCRDLAGENALPLTTRNHIRTQAFSDYRKRHETTDQGLSNKNVLQ